MVPESPPLVGSRSVRGWCTLRLVTALDRIVDTMQAALRRLAERLRAWREAVLAMCAHTAARVLDAIGRSNLPAPVGFSFVESYDRWTDVGQPKSNHPTAT